MEFKLPAPPWSPEILAHSFGFRPPDAFVGFLAAVGDGCTTADEVDHRLWEITGWSLSGEDMRYASTAPEIFPVARNGSNGEHFGYVVHAPEIYDPEDDRPIVQISPMGDDGVIIIGATTSIAFSNQISLRLFEDDGEPWDEVKRCAWWPDLAPRLAALGVRPSDGLFKLMTRCTPEEVLHPYVPPTWRHEPSSDGVGVLAPEKCFNPALSFDDPAIECATLDLPAMLRLSCREFKAGYLASALWLAREGYLHSWSEVTSEVFDTCETMRQIYLLLDRPQLARAIEQRLTLLEKIRDRR